MKNSEIIEGIIEIVINSEGANPIAELEWLFGELSTARILEEKGEKNDA